MDYSDAIRAIWRHHDLSGAAHDYVNLVRYATLAASSHNTQPWRFKLEPGRIVVLPDLTRRCPEVDPDDHHLYASLGCAAENLLLAARAAGLEGHASCDGAPARITIALESATPHRSALFDAILERQCSRTEYDGSQLSSEQLRLLSDAGHGSGVSVMLLTERQQKEQIAEYVTAGNTAQFGDRRWAEEMKKWIRFNAREATHRRDGLYGAVLGIPNVPRWLGEASMGLLATAKRQNEKDIAHIRSSAAIAVFFSAVDDPRHWIAAGRSCERLTLEAAALKLRTAFINQPVEVPALRAQLASFLGISARPDLVVRIGRGRATPRSLRRPVEDVLL